MRDALIGVVLLDAPILTDTRRDRAGRHTRRKIQAVLGFLKEDQVIVSRDGKDLFQLAAVLDFPDIPAEHLFGAVPVIRIQKQPVHRADQLVHVFRSVQDVEEGYRHPPGELAVRFVRFNAIHQVGNVVARAVL